MYVLASVSGLTVCMLGEVVMKEMGTVLYRMSTYDILGQTLPLKVRAKDNSLSMHLYLIMLDSTKGWHDSVGMESSLR